LKVQRLRFASKISNFFRNSLDFLSNRLFLFCFFDSSENEKNSFYKKIVKSINSLFQSAQAEKKRSGERAGVLIGSLAPSTRARVGGHK